MNMLAPQRRRLVIVGNGMAGIRTLEEVLARTPHEFDVTVLGAEPYGNYNRIMLSPVLAGEKRFADIVTHDRAWYADRCIELIVGEAVVEIDRSAREVRGEHGTRRGYDVLLLATGSNPVILPIPGANLPGVLGFRDFGDVETMLSARRPGARAVVIGGGLLGLEAAHGLSRNGITVTVLHLMPTLMERQLDPVSAELLRADLEARGIGVVTQANTAAIIGETQVRAVGLADGRELPADIVVMAVGIRPNVTLARAAGLDIGRGVKVDAAMRTSDRSIYAVGECVEHQGAAFGLVAPIWEMAKVCADNITDSANSTYVPSVSGTRLKVTGIDMFSAGDFLGDDATEEIVLRDASRGVHRRLVLRKNKLAGVVLYGDAADSGWYFDLLRSNTDITTLRDGLIFGPEAGDGSASGVEALPDTAEICGCNGISKGRILAAIAEHGLTSVEAVRARTKASSSCGSCTSQVEALLRFAVGTGYDAAPKVKPMCKCTLLGTTPCVLPSVSGS
jgi:nitrite reductase (NADH) large subunit